MAGGDEGGPRPRGLFVVGAPRSGTTLIGNYLGSSPEALNLGEFGGFHLAYNIAPSALGAMPGTFRDAYLDDLRTHAAWFAEGLAATEGRGWYCDATPFNLAAMGRIAADLPDAVFVVMLRHYAGCIQSLRRSFDSGFAWAGRTWADSAEVWAASYRSAFELPPGRTVLVSYEAVTGRPRQTLEGLRTTLASMGYPTDALDLGELAVSHAPPSTGPRATIGIVEDGEVQLRPIPCFDPGRWSGDIHRQVWPVVQDVHRRLLEQYPTVYGSPAAPRRLWVHHDIQGLVEADLGDEW
jgi:hypothetical protein